MKADSAIRKQNMTALHFLPEDLLPLKLLAKIHGREGRRPNAVQFSAVVMFIDVSRYTALVEQLARRGRDGLEDLPRLLSRSYGRCSEHVASYGGEVLYFAGDSLIAYWDAESDRLGAAVRSAIDCAETICRTGNDRGLGEITPALHIGIGAGELWAAALGEKPIWNLVAGGDAVNQAATALGTARSWEYQVSEAATYASTGSLVREASHDQQDTSSFAMPAIEWMASFLPIDVREQLSASETNLRAIHGSLSLARNPLKEEAPSLSQLNEIRPVSAVFARISGLSCSDEHALQQHQSVCASLQRITESLGGPPGNLFYDDKGLVFSTTFGARGNFHRDDAKRAVDAARTISETLDQLGHASSIGVATGDALFGFVGSERRCQFMVHGAPINRAARLMMAADRGVLCDAPTERATRSAFRFAPRGTLQLAGLGDMAAVFCPTGTQAATSPHATMVGRRIELALLHRTFAEVQSGGKRLLVLLGELGIGKSTLIGCFSEQLQAKGTTIAIAPAERDDRRSSLLPWRRLLASLLQMEPDADAADVLEAISVRVACDPKDS